MHTAVCEPGGRDMAQVITDRPFIAEARIELQDNVGVSSGEYRDTGTGSSLSISLSTYNSYCTTATCSCSTHQLLHHCYLLMFHSSAIAALLPAHVPLISYCTTATCSCSTHQLLHHCYLLMFHSSATTL